MYRSNDSWGRFKEQWHELSVVFRALFYISIKAVDRYRVIILIFSVFLFGFWLTQCNEYAYLSNNGVNQKEMEEIVEAINCAWSNKLDACFCIYVNSGQVGFTAPDKSCGK